MFIKANKSKGTMKFQTDTQNKFNYKNTNPNVSVSTFTPSSNKTITPNESIFISTDRRSYN